MTSALLGILQSTPQLRWVVATVASVQVGSVTITYLGTEVPNVGYLSSYTPSPGDKVHCLLQDPTGIIILGRQEQVAASPLPTPAAPVVVTPTNSGTYNLVPGLWTTPNVSQSPSTNGAWFYSAAALSSIPDELTKFEIEINISTTDPVSFVLHSNASASGAFSVVSDEELRAIPTGETTWASLPLSWATALRNGEAKGVGLRNLVYSTLVSSGGSLRFTPL